MEKKESMCTLAGYVNRYGHYGKQFGGSSKISTNYHMIQQFQFWVKNTVTKIQAVLYSVQHYLHWPRYVNNLRMIKEYRKCRDRKMAEEQVDVECISLHGCIRNTPSDTEDLAEHQLRMGKHP